MDDRFLALAVSLARRLPLGRLKDSLQKRAVARARAGVPSNSAIELWALTRWLYHEYLHGRLHPEVLARASFRPGAWAFGRLLCECVNVLVCVEVAAGRYEEALAWRERIFQRWNPPDAYDQLIRINEAEALANLGRWEDALTWTREPRHAWLKAGLAGHRAWVLSNLGKLDEARAAIERTRAAVLPRVFQAEWHFAVFSIALRTRDFTLAERALLEAERVQVRASTRRNVVFYKGLLEHTRGNHAAAVVHFCDGAQHEYRGQGGEALLAWGDSLRALGREDEAQAAFRLCLDRDAQSPAAATARARLHG